jgi:hypothetical protein
LVPSWVISRAAHLLPRHHARPVIGSDGSPSCSHMMDMMAWVSCGQQQEGEGEGGGAGGTPQ